MTAPKSYFHTRFGEASDLLREIDRHLASIIDANAGWETLELHDVQTLKEAVDHIRHTLWACIIGLEQHAEHHAGVALREYRMERIRQMLNELRRESVNDPYLSLFLAEVRRITES